MAREEQLQALFEQARWRDFAQQWGQFADRLEGVLLDTEVQLGREAHCAQHAHGVFLVAVRRVADQPQQAVANIVHAVGVIENALADRVVVQGVDGEVAALRVFFQGAVYVVTQDATTGVMRRTVAVILVIFRMRGTEGSDFDDFTAEMHMDQLEAAANDARITELGTDLFRGSAGGNVEVFRRNAQHQVADAATDQVGLVTGSLQALDNVHRVAAELVALQRVLALVDHLRRGAPVVLARYGRAERLEQLLQHGMHCLKECSAKNRRMAA